MKTILKTLDSISKINKLEKKLKKENDLMYEQLNIILEELHNENQQLKQSLDELQKENERLKKQIENLKEKPIIIDPTVYFNYLYSNGQGGFSGYIEKLDNDDAESCHLKLIWERENKK